MVYKCWDLRYTTGERFENRYGGIVNDSNQFAAALILLLPLVVNRALKSDEHWIIRVGAAVGAFGMFMAIILTGSRAAFLGLGVLVIAFLFFQKIYRKKAIVLLIFIGIIGFEYAPDYYLDRMIGMFSSEEREEDGAVTGRLEAWKLSVSIWRKHPLVGVGMHNFCYYMAYFKEDQDWGDSGHVAHSLWFEALAGGGLMVFIPLILLLLLFFYRLTRIKWQNNEDAAVGIYSYIYALQIGMLGFLVAATFVNRIYYEPIYWYCGIAVIYDRLVKERIANGKSLKASRDQKKVAANSGDIKDLPVAESK